jgi:hypothetical protein
MSAWLPTGFGWVPKRSINSEHSYDHITSRLTYWDSVPDVGRGRRELSDNHCITENLPPWLISVTQVGYSSEWPSFAIHTILLFFQINTLYCNIKLKTRTQRTQVWVLQKMAVTHGACAGLAKQASKYRARVSSSVEVSRRWNLSWTLN